MAICNRVIVAVVTLSLAIFLAACIRSPRAVSPLPYQDIPLPLVHQVYMPLVAGGLPDPDATCFGNPKALAFYRLMRDDPRQQRVEFRCNPALVRAAQKRAAGLATVDPWSHIDHDGVTPNQYARAAGCQLPESYPLNGNGIESLTAGTGDVGIAYESLTNGVSPAHQRHMLAETTYFREQTQVGIGYAEGGALGFYWAILTAPPPC